MTLRRMLPNVPLAALLCASGCGTIGTRTKGTGGTYSGVTSDLQKAASREEWLAMSGQGSAGTVPFVWPRGIVWILDTPLSFAADTVLLPFDALRPKAPEADSQEHGAGPAGPKQDQSSCPEASEFSSPPSSNP